MKLGAKSRADIDAIRSKVEAAYMEMGHVYAEIQQIPNTNDMVRFASSLKQPSPYAMPPITSLDLLRTLDVDPTPQTRDLEFVLKQASRMSAEDQGRSRWLTRTPQFQAWMCTPAHSLFLADGAMRLERISPMSVLTGTLATSLIEVPSVVTVYFFCGRNLDEDAGDELSGPNGMLRSLITQLILFFTPPSPSLSSMKSPDFLCDFYNQTLPVLCEVFRLLVEQLPPWTKLYCLLDGISLYEQGHWVTDLRFIVGMFEDMIKQPGGPVVKVLMTSANRSTEVRDLVDIESQYVSLAAGNIDYVPLVPHSVFTAIPIAINNPRYEVRET